MIQSKTETTDYVCGCTILRDTSEGGNLIMAYNLCHSHIDQEKTELLFKDH